MTLKQLQFFKITAELENISKSADALYIAQPAMSKAINDLENELGYPLFDRNGKRISLNQNGEILYKYVLQIQSEISQMQNELREVNAQEAASIHISVRVASKLLPDILNSFYSKYPEANIRIYQMNRTVKNLPDYDIILDSKDMKAEEITPQEVLLLEERILLAVPSSHPLANKETIFLSDLEGLPSCLLNEFSSLGKMVRGKLATKHFTPNIIFESDNPHMVRDFLKLDLSYSFVPENTWQLKKDFTNLILREVEDFSCSRYIYLSYDKNKYMNQVAKEFISHVKDYFLLKTSLLNIT